MINKQLIAHRFSRAVESYNREAVAQKQIAHRMNDMLAHYLPERPKRVLEIGSGTGFLTRCLMDTLHPEKLILNDICREMGTCFTDLLVNKQVTFVPGDAEKLSFPSGQDLIVSCSAIQWFISPGQFFERCNALLSGRGYFAFTTFGKENLKEVATVTGNGLHYHSLKELEQALQLHYDIVTASEEQIQLTFDTPLQVLYHLKHTGVTAVRQQAWTKGDLQHFCDQYARLFGNGKSVTLTYHPIYIIAKKK
ncbi:malonyl-ACP O-methyltransferase BioC [Phocaeicola sp.]